MEQRRGGPPPGLRPPERAPVSDDDLTAIIERGDAERLVETVRRLADNELRGLTTHQVRRFFGDVRRIERDWPGGATEEEAKRAHRAQRQLVLLKPKLHYQAQRVREFRSLEGVLAPAIDLVGGDRERFQNFVDFFEAIVAYTREREGG